MKVKEIKQVIENLSDEDEVYCVYIDSDELHFSLETEQDIIDDANEILEEDYYDENEEYDQITDIDSAMQTILDFDDDKHILE